MTRTQVYLDDDQREALRILAASRASTVSDLVREAINRLLAGEIANGSFADRVSAVQSRLRARLGDVSDDDVASALARTRARRRSNVSP